MDWVIADHKSQGLFQTNVGQDRFENFWLFADNDSRAIDRANALFATVNGSSASGPRNNATK